MKAECNNSKERTVDLVSMKARRRQSEASIQVWFWFWFAQAGVRCFQGGRGREGAALCHRSHAPAGCSRCHERAGMQLYSGWEGALLPASNLEPTAEGTPASSDRWNHKLSGPYKVLRARFCGCFSFIVPSSIKRYGTYTAISRYFLTHTSNSLLNVSRPANRLLCLFGGRS